MRRRKSAHTIYNHARGDGWILTALDSDEREDVPRGHQHALVLYYTEEERIETRRVTSGNGRDGVDTFLRQYLDIGGKLGSYPGTSPVADTEFEDQPRAVRMQRHASDLYGTIGNATGLSETMAVRAAEEFGSTWREKRADDWADRVKQCGEGTANSIELQMKRRGIIDSPIKSY